MYLLLSGLTVLRFAFIFSKWKPFLFSWSFVRLAELWFGVLRGLSSIPGVLFHVAETKLYQFILWSIHFTFSPVECLKRVYQLTVAYRGVDGDKMVGGTPMKFFPIQM